LGFSEKLWDFLIDVFFAYKIVEIMVFQEVQRGTMRADQITPNVLVSSKAMLTLLVTFIVGYGFLVWLGKRSKTVNRIFRMLVGFAAALASYVVLMSLLTEHNKKALQVLLGANLAIFFLVSAFFIVTRIRNLVDPWQTLKTLAVVALNAASIIAITGAVFQFLAGGAFGRPGKTQITGGMFLFVIIDLALIVIIVVLQEMPILRGNDFLYNALSSAVCAIGIFSSIYVAQVKYTQPGAISQFVFALIMVICAWLAFALLRAIFGGIFGKNK